VTVWVVGQEQETVGRQIRARREKLKLTQSALAAELGVTHQHVSRIETGQVSPSLELLVKLSRRLGVSTDYLLTGDDYLVVDLVGAIRSDTRLTTAVKKHLVGLIDELRD
jgi:transcriptional regulator with XRE-family HTH domain